MPTGSSFTLPRPVTSRERDSSSPEVDAGDRASTSSAVLVVLVPVAKPWTCMKCNSTLPLSRSVARQLESHAGSHRMQVRYSCSKCIQHTSDSYQSVATHHGRCRGPLPSIGPVTCPVPGCQFSCTKRAGLGQHSSWRHPELQMARRRRMYGSTGFARASKWYSDAEIELIQRGMDRGQSPTTVLASVPGRSYNGVAQKMLRMRRNPIPRPVTVLPSVQSSGVVSPSGVVSVFPFLCCLFCLFGCFICLEPHL